MPPRYAYWTILIDGQPTAFRAREQAELQPTLVQLQRKNSDVTMRWFARGKLWESREAEQADFEQQRRAANEPRDRRDRPQGVERRGGDWRPGGTHKDPRDRFKKKNRPERAWSEKDPATQRDRDKPGYVAKKPWTDKPRGEGKPAWSGKPAEARRPGPFGPGEKKPWAGKPRKPWEKPPSQRFGESGKPPVPNDRPWQTKPTGPRAQRKPWIPKPSGDRPAGGPPRGDRPPAHRSAFDNRKREGGWTKKPEGEFRGKPAGGPPRSDRPPTDRSAFDNRKREGGWTKKPEGGGWRGKPAGGPPRGDRPPAHRSAFDNRKREGGWTKKPEGGGWRGKPAGGPPRGDRPRGGAPGGDRKFNPRAPRTDGRPPKRRDDDPDRD